MEKDQFVAVENQGWWLLEPDLDAALEERRRTLGECWDWTDLRWYAERLKLEEVYQFLELNRADLLRELDDASDLYRRQKWLDDVIKAKRPAKPTTAEEAAPAAQKAADARPAQAPAAKKASAFGRRPAAELRGPRQAPHRPRTPRLRQPPAPPRPRRGLNPGSPRPSPRRPRRPRSQPPPQRRPAPPSQSNRSESRSPSSLLTPMSPSTLKRSRSCSRTRTSPAIWPRPRPPSRPSSKQSWRPPNRGPSELAARSGRAVPDRQPSSKIRRPVGSGAVDDIGMVS